MTTHPQDTHDFGRGSGAPTAPTTVLPPPTVTARRRGLAAPVLRRVCDGLCGALLLDLLMLCAWWGIDLDGEDSDDGVDWDH